MNDVWIRNDYVFSFIRLLEKNFFANIIHYTQTCSSIDPINCLRCFSKEPVLIECVIISRPKYNHFGTSTAYTCRKIESTIYLRCNCKTETNCSIHLSFNKIRMNDYTRSIANLLGFIYGFVFLFFNWIDNIRSHRWLQIGQVMQTNTSHWFICEYFSKNNLIKHKTMKFR